MGGRRGAAGPGGESPGSPGQTEFFARRLTELRGTISARRQGGDGAEPRSASDGLSPLASPSPAASPVCRAEAPCAERDPAELEMLQKELAAIESHVEKTDEWSQGIGSWKASVQQVLCEGEDARDPALLLVVAQGEEDDPKARGWVVARRLSETVELHTQLRLCVDWLPKKPRWNAARLRGGMFGAPRGEALRRAAALLRDELNEFLKQVLADELLCGSEALFKFLSPTADAIADPSSRPGSRMGSQPSSRPSSRTGGHERTDSGGSGEGGGWLAKLGIGGRRSAPAEPSADVDAGVDTLLEESEESLEEIAEPIYYLISEIFVLKGAFTWLRRQLILFVRLTYGGTMSNGIKSTVEWLVSEEWVQFYLELMRDAVFPEGWEEPPPPTDEEKSATRAAAREALLAGIPDAVRTLVGAKNARMGAERVFKAIQFSHMNRHLAYTLLEKFLEHFLEDELEGRDLYQCLVQLDASEDIAEELLKPTHTAAPKDRERALREKFRINSV